MLPLCVVTIVVLGVVVDVSARYVTLNPDVSVLWSDVSARYVTLNPDVSVLWSDVNSKNMALPDDVTGAGTCRPQTIVSRRAASEREIVTFIRLEEMKDNVSGKWGP